MSVLFFKLTANKIIIAKLKRFFSILYKINLTHFGINLTHFGSVFLEKCLRTSKIWDSI